MARIRTIKPEFPQSETVGKLSREARLLYVQLWTLVDDSGRARAASRMLASLLYPYDDDAPALMEAWLAELEEKGAIRRYEADGAHYLDIPKWLKHQKIDKPTPSRLPEFREGSATPREGSRKVAPDLGPGPRTLDHGRDQETPSLRSGGAREDFRPQFDEFWKAYPHKVGKKAAYKAFVKAAKSGAVTFDRMLFALTAYVNKTDDRAWCNPATWLNEGRWDDQPAPEVRNGRSVLAAADRLIDKLGGRDAAAAYVPGSAGPQPLSLDFGDGAPSPKLIPAR